MPKVGKKKFPYTKKGKMDAQHARMMEKGGPMMMEEKKKKSKKKK